MDPTTVGSLAKPRFELLPGQVKCGGHRLGGGFRPDRRAGGDARQLDPLARVSQPRIAFAGNLDIDPDDLRAELLDLAQLLLDVRPDARRNLHFPASHYDLHGT